MTTPTIDIRILHSIGEFEQAEALQRAVWEMRTDLDIVPLHLLVTAQKNGGLALGAFADGKLVGFLFGFLGRESDGRLKHCSHMMGILAEYRGRRVGERLKRRQRDVVLEQGLDLVTWTYDPLETVNAMLNIGKLGATCRTYLRNIYGELRDDLNKGLPTDRFQVDWWLQSSRVTLRSHPERVQRPSFPALVEAGAGMANETEVNAAGLSEPRGWSLVSEQVALVEVPWSLQRIKAHDIALAAAWRLETRALFEAYFDAGYVVTDAVLHPETGRPRFFYVLETSSSSPS